MDFDSPDRAVPCFSRLTIAQSSPTPTLTCALPLVLFAGNSEQHQLIDPHAVRVPTSTGLSTDPIRVSVSLLFPPNAPPHPRLPATTPLFPCAGGRHQERGSSGPSSVGITLISHNTVLSFFSSDNWHLQQEDNTMHRTNTDTTTSYSVFPPSQHCRLCSCLCSLLGTGAWMPFTRNNPCFLW